jgi:hypothetical protein
VWCVLLQVTVFPYSRGKVDTRFGSKSAMLKCGMPNSPASGSFFVAGVKDVFQRIPEEETDELYVKISRRCTRSIYIVKNLSVRPSKLKKKFFLVI